MFFGIGQGLDGAGAWATDGNFLGSGLSGAGFAVKTISHGLAGGAISRLQGGKFGHGFASAAGSAATAPFADMSSKAGVYQGAVVSTIVGGTLSKLSGGKFANGAVTAAMSYAFNRLQEQKIKSMVRDQGVIAVSVSGRNQTGGYGTIDDAVKAQYGAFQSEYAAASGQGNELFGAIIERQGNFYFTDMAEVDAQFKGQLSVSGAVRGDAYAAFTHTHADSASFSGLDYKLPSKSGYPFYVRNSGGDVFAWASNDARKYESHVNGLKRGGALRVHSSEIDRQKWKIRTVCNGCIK